MARFGRFMMIYVSFLLLLLTVLIGLDGDVDALLYPIMPMWGVLAAIWIAIRGIRVLCSRIPPATVLVKFKRTRRILVQIGTILLLMRLYWLMLVLWLLGAVALVSVIGLVITTLIIIGQCIMAIPFGGGPFVAPIYTEAGLLAGQVWLGCAVAGWVSFSWSTHLSIHLDGRWREFDRWCYLGSPAASRWSGEPQNQPLR